MKRQLSATLQRSVRRASTWRPKASGDEVIDIRRLVSPLRYDVLVRARFFDLAEDLDDRPLSDLVDAARASDYRTWFTRVAMARYRPWVLADERQLEVTFAQRVGSARDLFRSVRDRGFDARHRIVLRWTPEGTLNELGVPMARQVHVGDGGHRLAILLRNGGSLHPSMYVVDSRPMPLIDNTVRLFGADDVDSAAYLGFLGQGYTGVSASTAEGLLALVAEHEGREAADELSAVMGSHRLAWRLKHTATRLA